jgi:hypothetical protein
VGVVRRLIVWGQQPGPAPPGQRVGVDSHQFRRFHRAQPLPPTQGQTPADRSDAASANGTRSVHPTRQASSKPAASSAASMATPESVHNAWPRCDAGGPLRRRTTSASGSTKNHLVGPGRSRNLFVTRLGLRRTLAVSDDDHVRLPPPVGSRTFSCRALLRRRFGMAVSRAAAFAARVIT